MGSVPGGGTEITNAGYVAQPQKKKKKRPEETGVRTSSGLCDPHAGP